MLTHTRPWPPPAAGGLVAASALALFAGAGLAAAGAADAEVFGLNKSPSVNLAGVADAAGLAAELAAVSVFAFLLLRFSAGEAEAAAVLSAAGEAAAVASAFLCARRPGDGDAAGDSAVEGDAASSAGEGVASAFLCARCFVNEGDASGDPPGTSN